MLKRGNLFFFYTKAASVSTTSKTGTTTTLTTNQSIQQSNSNRVIPETIDWNDGLNEWQPSHPYPSFKSYLGTLGKRRPNRGLGEFDEPTGLFLPLNPHTTTNHARSLAQKENFQPNAANNNSSNQANKPPQQPNYQNSQK